MEGRIGFLVVFFFKYIPLVFWEKGKKEICFWPVLTQWPLLNELLHASQMAQMLSVGASSPGCREGHPQCWSNKGCGSIHAPYNLQLNGAAFMIQSPLSFCPALPRPPDFKEVIISYIWFEASTKQRLLLASDGIQRPSGFILWD